MRIVDSVEGSLNYATTSTTQTVHKVATNPSAVKKVLQIATKSFAAFDLYFVGKPQDRKITDVMKGSVDLIEFYGAFKDVMFWINPFSKGTLDKEALLESLQFTLCAPIQDKNSRKQNKEVAQEIFTEMMEEEAFYSKSEVRDVLKEKMIDHGFKPFYAEQMVDKIVIQQKARPITLLFSTACFTFVDVLGCVLTLKKWDVVNYAFIAAKIGTQSPVFLFVIELGVETVFGTVASAALIVTFGEATYRAVNQGIILYNGLPDDDKQQAYKELRAALIDMLSSSADLVNTAAPLLFALNPPAVIAIAIVAKSTGLICILVK